MVHDALHQLDLAGVDIVFIENVGNLVCPASFDLGHHRNITLLSVTEGDDKPAKYPVMFRAADLMLVTKSDLLKVLDDFDPRRAEQHLRELANGAPVLDISARDGQGMATWLDWLRDELLAQRNRVAEGRTAMPAVQPDGARLHAHAHDRHPHHHHDHASHQHDHDPSHS
jgi:hydrogenase nickel incorporation protein HypB